MTQTITAMYDERAAAQTTMERLVAAGIPQASLKLIAGSATSAPASAGSYDHTRDEGGFWAQLKDAFMPEEDRYTYTEGLSRGGTMLSATVEEDHVQTALDIMDDEGSIDLDEREASWRAQGWTGYRTTSTAGSTVGAAGMTSASGAPPLDVVDEARSARDARTGGDETISLVAERMNVGKRVVDGGRVRLRSYVIETPVSEQVSLRDETVHVDRRTVDRAPTPADEALFAERTIEATSMREQAVVSKDARVTGEVGLRKEATERVETVSDKVRHTEVEVEDERGQVARTGTTDTAGTAGRKPV